MSFYRTGPPSPGLRGRVEEFSYPLLVRLTASPRWLLVAVMAALLIAGLFAPPAVGVPCLVIVVAFLGWLTYLAWPHGDGHRKVVRVVALGLATLAIIARALS